MIKWGVKRVGIGISEFTQTAPDNFETSYNCYEVLTDSLLNGEALYIRAHTNQVREGHEVGR